MPLTQTSPASPSAPLDATLTVAKAARLLGVHPNTVRAWSDQGRLRYYRINRRGDRRYRLIDLQRFLAALGDPTGAGEEPAPGPPASSTAGRPSLVGSTRGAAAAVDPTHEGAGASELRRSGEGPGRLALVPRLPGTALSGELGEVEARTLAEVAEALGRPDLESGLASACEALRVGLGHAAVGVWRLDRGRLRLTAASPAGDPLAGEPGATDHLLARTLEGSGGVLVPLGPPEGEWAARAPGAGDARRPRERRVAAAAIRVARRAWGVLAFVGDEALTLERRDAALVEAVARIVATAVGSAERLDRLRRDLERAETLRRIAADLGAGLDLDRTLRSLVDHAITLFAADRAAVRLRGPDGRCEAEVSRNLSPTYLASLREVGEASLCGAALAARRPVAAVRYADDPRAAAHRAAVLAEGFDTLSAAPLLDGDRPLGVLEVFHDRPRPWPADDLELLAELAAQGAVAIGAARDYRRTATWAAQLQSIQQLGTRLNSLSTVSEIGGAIASELGQLIDYHNVRVYRLYGDELVPVALQGRVGEYVDETAEQLRLRLGEGITGWVALHRVPQYLPDAATDPRARTIPGTEEDLPESMLLAPMVFEDRVLGVLVLSKLGLAQFGEDDLRLLTIYASFAAQAMANADATERLREQSDRLARRLEAQRQLLRLTESILTTLDPKAVLDQVAEHLGSLVAHDNISIERYDRTTGELRPLAARGVHAAEFLQPWLPGERGVAHWVVERNEPVLIADERADPRVNDFRAGGPVAGSLIVVPLRDREGPSGVLTLERLGADNRFTDEDFELVQLFAAHVSIALQNAEVHRAVEIRAQTDNLTGLLNHGTFHEWLQRMVGQGERFSLVMVDLDDFKAVNDTLGHQAGDRLLREIAEAIVRVGRESDRVFRYGGDEFAILLPGTDRRGAAEVAERVAAAIGGVGGPGSAWRGVRISGSIGHATYPDDGSTAEGVLLAADRACFVAKRSGHGRIATAVEGLALAAEFSPQAPTPVDEPTI